MIRSNMHFSGSCTKGSSLFYKNKKLIQKQNEVVYYDSEVKFKELYPPMHDLINENIIHIQKDGWSYIQFRRLLEFPEVKHMYTLKGLDFGSVDRYEAMKDEAKRSEVLAAAELGTDATRLCRARQTHTNRVLSVNEDDLGIFPKRLDNVDGLMTDTKNMFLLLTFADCTPLLFYDPVKRVIANTHSGWKGTLQRIGEKTVEGLKAGHGCDPADLICCIGPHIRKECFEVDADVAERFAEEFKEFDHIREWISWDEEKKKYFIDTLSINVRILEEAGLKHDNIIDSGICTVCGSDVCHSYRADRVLSGRSALIAGLL